MRKKQKQTSNHAAPDVRMPIRADAHLASRHQPLPLARQHKIEAGYSFLFYLPHLDQQVRPEQRILSFRSSPGKYSCVVNMGPLAA